MYKSRYKKLHLDGPISVAFCHLLIVWFQTYTIDPIESSAWEDSTGSTVANAGIFCRFESNILEIS